MGAACPPINNESHYIDSIEHLLIGDHLYKLSSSNKMYDGQPQRYLANVSAAVLQALCNLQNKTFRLVLDWGTSALKTELVQNFFNQNSM